MERRPRQPSEGREVLRPTQPEPHDTNGGAVAVNQADASSMPVDPVCGLEITLVGEGVEQTELNGRTYWFCSLRCRWLFETDPERYAI